MREVGKLLRVKRERESAILSMGNLVSSQQWAVRLVEMFRASDANTIKSNPRADVSQLTVLFSPEYPI